MKAKNWKDYYTADGMFHAEQDLSWNAKGSRVSENTWTIYEKILILGGIHTNSYQTPRFFCKNEKEALAKIAELNTMANNVA
jgi:hypothetical protein